MNWTYIVIYAHLVGAVFFVGYFLFWALLTNATWREHPGEKAKELLQQARSASWPLPGYQPSLRLIGWLLVVFLVITGVLAILSGASAAGSLGTATVHAMRGVKVLLLGVLVVCMPRLGSSRPPLAVFSLAVALLIVAISEELIR